MSVENDELSTTQIYAGRYRLEKVLGCGGMGKVYLAQDTVLINERIALKILHEDLCKDEKHTKRFLREVQLTRKVTHPNVVRTFDVGTNAGTLFFTMELVEGVSLKERIKNQDLTFTESIKIIQAICLGLDAIHAAGIVHRDLKPGNVIITPEGVPKITDFGVARPGSSDLTGLNEIVGSVPYMPPEVWLGQNITPAADIYALGVVAYELMTGILPFDGDAPAELMCKHLESKPVPPIELVKNVPEWINFLVLEMLAKNPEHRPASAKDIAQYIERQLETNELVAAENNGTENSQHPEELILVENEHLSIDNYAANIGAQDANAIIAKGPSASGFDYLESMDYARPPGLDPTLRNSSVKFIKSAPSIDSNLKVLLRAATKKAVGLCILFAFASLFLFILLGPINQLIAHLTNAGQLADSRRNLFLGLAAPLLSYALIISLPALFLAYSRRSLRDTFVVWLEVTSASAALLLIGFVLTCLQYGTRIFELGNENRFFELRNNTLALSFKASLLLLDANHLKYGLSTSKALNFIRPNQTYLLLFVAFILMFAYFSKKEILCERSRNVFALMYLICAFCLSVGIASFIAPVVLGLFGEAAKTELSIVFEPIRYTFSLATVILVLLNWTLIFILLCFYPGSRDLDFE